MTTLLHCSRRVGRKRDVCNGLRDRDVIAAFVRARNEQARQVVDALRPSQADRELIRAVILACRLPRAQELESR